MNGTPASANCAIMRSRYVLSTAAGLLTARTPETSSVLTAWSAPGRSHMRNMPRGLASWKPLASRPFAVRRRISVSSLSRPGECASSRKMPQQ